MKEYNEANKQVAILCNHQKAVEKGFDEKLGKNEEKLKDLEEYVKNLNKHVKLLNSGKSGLKSEDKA